MPPTDHSLPIAIVGGGITGLTAAWHLKQAGSAVAVFEASADAGGAIGSVRHDGWLQEAGPNSLLEGSADVAEFINAIGLGSRRLYAAASAKNRYVVREGRLLPVPTSPLGFIKTGLFSWRAKLNLLGEPFRARASADSTESVAMFVERRLGREFLDYAVNPFVGGVYAGDPRQLSVRYAFPKLHALEQAHGSLLRGAIKRRNASGGPKGRIFSFPEGLAELPRALAHSLGDAMHFSTRATTIRLTGGQWEIVTEHAGVSRTEKFSTVICALPADALRALRFEGVPGAERLGALSEIPHPSVVSIFTGFRRENVAHPLDGFGLLMPEVEQRRILGTLFSSTLFPGRAPAGHVALTTFVGGVRSPQLAQLDDAALEQLVREELGDLLGVRGDPVYFKLHRWPRAIPQYTLDHGRFQEIFASVESAAPGLHFGGNARDGISLANCISSGRRLATAAGKQPK